MAAGMGVADADAKGIDERNQQSSERRITMKIAVPVDETDSQSVCVSFGRTPYFLIYDTETKEKVVLDNSAAASTGGGAGIRAAQVLVDIKVSALLTPRCGQNAANVLEAAGVKIYRTTGSSVKDNTDAFLSGTLPLLDEIHAGFHGHRGR